jgi:uncharacterized membrane protein
MFVVKLIGKLLLIPVIVLLFALNLAVATIGGIYGVIHSLFWGLLAIIVFLFACFGMWPQAVLFFVVMMMSLLVVTMFELISTSLGGALGKMEIILNRRG